MVSIITASKSLLLRVILRIRITISRFKRHQNLLLPSKIRNDPSHLGFFTQYVSCMNSLCFSDVQLLSRFGVTPSITFTRRQYVHVFGIEVFYDRKTRLWDILSPYRTSKPRGSLLLTLLDAQNIREWLDCTPGPERLAWCCLNAQDGSVCSPVGPASAADAVAASQPARRGPSRRPDGKVTPQMSPGRRAQF